MRYKLCEVDPQQRKLAQLMVAEACRVLKIPTPAVKFFREATEYEDGFHAFEVSYDHAFGFTMASLSNEVEIFLRRNLPDMDLMQTAVHEVRHAWQCKSPEWRNRSAAMRERDAELFTAAWPRSESAAEKLVFKKLFAT